MAVDTLQRVVLCGWAILLIACGSEAAHAPVGEATCGDAGCAPSSGPDRDGAQEEPDATPGVMPADAAAADAGAADASAEDARAVDAESADAAPSADAGTGCPEYAEQLRPLTACAIAEPPVDCLNAVSIEHGHDADGDGALAESEVESARIACIAPTTCEIDVEYPDNLVGCQLPGADLHGRDLNNFNTSADLSGANLMGASCGFIYMEDLSSGYCHFECADLSGADLSGAELWVPHFGGADLSGAVLRDASLLYADLSGAIVTDADFAGADLSMAHLEHADFSGANLSAAILRHAHAFGLAGCPAVLPDATWLCAAIVRPLCGAPSAQVFMLLGPSVSLEGADLSGQDLSDANLRGAKLGGTRLTGAHLHGGNLDSADLAMARTAELASCPAVLPSERWRCVAQPALAKFALVGPGATLSNTDFTDADLSGADLRGADLSGSYGEPASVVDTLTDSSTRCSDEQPGPCW